MLNLDRWKGAPAATNLASSRVADGGTGRLADLICFSHLRWNFVFQRPQHLMTRAAQERRVFYWEEPLFADPGDGVREASTRCSGDP